ncbi:MAG TPA: cytochrome c peroxidase [Polyangia bacterium]|nr:cytochrome c peroxidase [Polyangia bacterium]
MGRPERLIATAATVVAAGLLAAGCHAADKAFCSSAGCAWTDLDWARVQSLSRLPAPPPDTSNNYYSVAEAAKLGEAFYFDTKFSGASTLLDSIGRPVASAREPSGTQVNISCASCHDPSWAGTDDTSVPNTVSIGAGIYDVNAQQTLVAAFFPLLYWNGRSDSLWAQALAVNESNFSMNGTRLKTFWRIVSNYADRYNRVFADYPLPASVDANEFPPQGKPGAMEGCQAGLATEPFGDAFDCLSGPDQITVNRVFVNFGKAIAAYEYTLATEYALASRDAPFDRFVRDGPGSGWISPQAENGARLFVSKASCIDCHNTPLLSDGRFHNIGVPQAGDHVPTVEDCAATPSTCNCAPGTEKEMGTCFPSGAWGGAGKLAVNKFRRDNIGSANNEPWSDAPDGGAEPCPTTQIAVAPNCATEDPTLEGAWRTPSLRDVSLTAPYMHDGYYQTLTEVVQHYNMGGVAGAADVFQLPLCETGDAGPSPCMDAGAPAPHLAIQIKPLDLTDEEVTDLVAFLGTLSAPALPPPDAGLPPPRSDDGGAARDAGPSQ